MWALFSPQAQGSIRPLGERAWFLLASSLFSVNDPFPLHLLAFLTQIVNVILVVTTGHRLLGSLAAASISATLWVMSDSLTEAMIWPSAYNEILCTCWFLLAFITLLRWIDSGNTVWLVAHIAATVAGLCTNELMVTLPLIAVMFVLFFARAKWAYVIPSSILVVLFIAAHMILVPLPRSGAYEFNIRWGLAANLLHYWMLVLGPAEYERVFQTSHRLMLGETALMSFGVLAWVIINIRRRRWTPLFYLLWFLIGMSPVLPLSKHFTPYYTFFPLIGLAWLAGDAAMRMRSPTGRILAVTCLILYMITQIPSTIFVRNWYRDRSYNVEARERHLLNAVQQIRRLRPDGPVFLEGLDTEQFWWGLCYGELSHLGFTDLHILPNAGQHGIVIPPPEWCLDTQFQLSWEDTERLLRQEPGRLYDIAVPLRRP